jgi:hypothetical protein
LTLNRESKVFRRKLRPLEKMLKGLSHELERAFDDIRKWIDLGLISVAPCVCVFYVLS